ncbi:hypothetical protein COLO4_32123 [Corchorus olitorius]|uniref:Uncharacterized protein n=1 Tax=Corchorus olitorius TaxID=93759 RepID=A0A1R3H180_9ROSI|nr:hypothetical protein COLO4_32123 [Corchorus olitorius]
MTTETREIAEGEVVCIDQGEMEEGRSMFLNKKEALENGCAV